MDRVINQLLYIHTVNRLLSYALIVKGKLGCFEYEFFVTF